MTFRPALPSAHDLPALWAEDSNRQVAEFAPAGSFVKPSVTYELLLKLVQFDGGRYFWRERPLEMFRYAGVGRVWNKMHSGKELAWESHREGYLRIRIFDKAYLAHRLVWLYHKGAWPTGEVDHINGNRSDNRIENLRDVPKIENARNRRPSAANTSGITGVHRVGKKWRARICVNGKCISLGNFDTIEDAAAARAVANERFGFHENHGKILEPGGRVAKDAAPIFDVAGICQLRIFTRKGSVRKYAEFIFIPVKEQ